LAPEQALVLEEDPRRARVTARVYLERYLRLPNYRSNLERLGYGEEDLAGQGSDRLVDAVVVHGNPGEVAAQVRAHLKAGADHVCVQPLTPVVGSMPGRSKSWPRFCSPCEPAPGRADADHERHAMARVLITGSSDGLGLGAAQLLDTSLGSGPHDLDR
jgi:hypothetical protein